MERAGIPKRIAGEGKIDFHATRTAYTTLLVEAGANVAEAQSIARHATPDLRMNVYARARNDRLANLAESVGRVVLGEADAIVEEPSEDLLAVDEAISRLEEHWPEKAKLVKLRYFAGLTIPEASRAPGISTGTAERHWRFARAWLHSELQAFE